MLLFLGAGSKLSKQVCRAFILIISAVKTEAWASAVTGAVFLCRLQLTSCCLFISVTGIHLHSSGPHALLQKLFCSTTVKFPFHELFNKQLKFYLDISLLGLFYYLQSYQGFKLCFNILKGCFHLRILFG